MAIPTSPKVYEGEASDAGELAAQVEAAHEKFEELFGEAYIAQPPSLLGKTVDDRFKYIVHCEAVSDGFPVAVYALITSAHQL